MVSAVTVSLWALYPPSVSTLSLNSYFVPMSSPVMIPLVMLLSSSYLFSHPVLLLGALYSMIYSSTEETSLSHDNSTVLDVVLTTFSPVGVTIVTSIILLQQHSNTYRDKQWSSLQHRLTISPVEWPSSSYLLLLVTNAPVQMVQLI